MSTGHENFLSYNEVSHILTLLSTNEDDVGSKEVTIEAYLVDYPEAQTTKSTFTVTITTCQVMSLLPVQLQKQAYGISQAPHIFEYLPFNYDPKCEAGVTYQV